MRARVRREIERVHDSSTCSYLTCAESQTCGRESRGTSFEVTSPSLALERRGAVRGTFESSSEASGVIWGTSVGLFEHIAKPFEHLAKRFELLAQPFEHLAQRFELLTQRFELLGQRFELLGQRFEHLGKRSSTSTSLPSTLGVLSSTVGGARRFAGGAG